MDNSWISSQESNLTRSLSRLDQYIDDKTIEQLLPAFYYGVTLLEKYFISEQDVFKKRGYYDQFERQISRLKQKIQKYSSEPHKPYKIAILNDIQTFLEKHRHIKEDAIQISQLLTLNSVKERQNAFKKGYQKAVALFEEHNLDDSFLEIQKLKENTGSYSKINEEMNKQIMQIEQQYLKMIELYSHFNSEDWIFDRQQDNVRLEYKVYEEQNTIAVRVFAQIDMEMLPFLAIVSQIDLQKQYVPFVSYSQQMKKLARNKKAGYSKTSVPLLSDRECYFYAVGYDRMKKTDSLFLFTQSFEQNVHFQKINNLIIPDLTDKLSLKVHYFCIQYKPISKTRAQIKIVTKADFKMPFLPLFILNKAARIFTFDYFSNIVDKAKQFKGSKWQQKVKNDPQLYKFFQAKIDEYFNELK